MHVIIVGAGTGGLCLAQALKAAGVGVAVYERDRTRTDGLFGFRVGISPGGSRALRACLPAELYDTFCATTAITPTYFNMLTEQMGELLSIEGADGTGSPVRCQYLPHAQLHETGLFGATGKLPLTDETRALLPPKVLRGVTMINAPHGHSTIIHVMEFPWGHDGTVKEGIGGNDAELLRAWPGLTFDNTRDYIMLGFGTHRRHLPDDYMRLSGPALHSLLVERTARWHPNLRTLYQLIDPTTCFPLNIRTSEPVDPWPTSNVTLIGDAIHTMTPGLGVGANTALRDARILGDNLIAARRGNTSVLDAIADYEARMHGYAWAAVAKSLERFSGDSAVFKPVIGRLALAGTRTAMRLVNHLPPVKRKMMAEMAHDRGHDQAAAQG